MKIAIICPGMLPVPPIEGGAVENLIYALINENEKNINNINITVYSVDGEKSDKFDYNPKYTKYEFIEPLRFYSKFKNSLISKILMKISKKYRRLPILDDVLNKLSSENFDYIVIENRPDYVIPVSKASNNKIILHLHNDHMCDNLYVKRKAEKKAILDTCNKVLVVSNYIKNNIIREFNEYEEKIHILHNGIDCNRFNNTYNKRKDELREKYGINRNDFVLIFAGRLSKEKGILELIKALSKLNKYDDIKLLVVGGSWFNSNKKSKYIKKLQKESKLLNNKIIFTGYINNSDMPNLYSISDVGIVPSVWNDPCPLTILEQMSMKLPIITTNSGGIPEEVNDKCAVILEKDVDLDDKLSKSIVELYSNKKLRESMAMNGELRARHFFSNEKFYENFIRILKL